VGVYNRSLGIQTGPILHKKTFFEISNLGGKHTIVELVHGEETIIRTHYNSVQTVSEIVRIRKSVGGGIIADIAEHLIIDKLERCLEGAENPSKNKRKKQPPKDGRGPS